MSLKPTVLFTGLGKDILDLDITFNMVPYPTIRLQVMTVIKRETI